MFEKYVDRKFLESIEGFEEEPPLPIEVTINGGNYNGTAYVGHLKFCEKYGRNLILIEINKEREMTFYFGEISGNPWKKMPESEKWKFGNELVKIVSLPNKIAETDIKRMLEKALSRTIDDRLGD